MDFRKIILISSIIILFSSLIAVSAGDFQYELHDLQTILNNNDVDDMTGCCSVVLQEDGNNSVISFRRDAENMADIFIVNETWHGKQVLKQYKTSAGYFCQVIVTNDGWVIGYGGMDDGPDNEHIENITGKMIQNSTNISEGVMAEIQGIKAAYGLGHAIIKAPNGDYGIATGSSYSFGKLKPGQYISIPNRAQFIRTGTLDYKSSDKISNMIELAMTDGFGVTRRDVTTFDFVQGNETDKSNVTYAYVSNDDGSMYGMSTAGLCDNIDFLGKYINATDIPIGPKYMKMGNYTFESNETSTDNMGNSIINMVIYAIIAIIIAIVVFISYHVVKVLRFRRRYRR